MSPATEIAIEKIALEERLARIAEILDKAEVVAEIPTRANAGASRVAFKLPEEQARELAELLKGVG